MKMSWDQYEEKLWAFMKNDRYCTSVSIPSLLTEAAVKMFLTPCDDKVFVKATKEWLRQIRTVGWIERNKRIDV